MAIRVILPFTGDATRKCYTMFVFFSERRAFVPNSPIGLRWPVVAAKQQGVAGEEKKADGEAHLTGVGLDHWGDAFPSTHWSIVLDGSDDQDSATRRMLERLCSRYWYPLYAFLRKRGYSSHDAQDHTQGFFAKMLDGDGLSGIDRDRGRFRSYMIGAMNHYLSDRRKRDNAAKRGGGRQPVSIDEELAEQRFRNEAMDDLSPEKMFDREWAVAVLSDAHERLRSECVAKGRGQVFELLGEYLTEKPDKGSYPALAERLETSPGNVRVMVVRLRNRYQEMLKEIIAEMVESPDAVEAELAHLRAAFANS